LTTTKYITKVKITELIFTFTPEAQKLLCHMCHPSGMGEMLIKNKNCINELIAKNFCTSDKITIQVISEYPLPCIKDLIYEFGFDNPPKKLAHKPTVLKWLTEHETEFLSAVNSEYVRLILTEGANELKNTIYRRYFSRFETYVNDIGVSEIKEVFVQEQPK